jgi:hypothetical protein
MAAYEMTPASTATAQGRWPAASHLTRDWERPTLVTFVHPRCPCSRASLAELERLTSDCRERFSHTIVFVRPAGFAPGWERTGLWNTAKRLEGASLVCDPQGREAARFGATASGETFLYARDGQLLFHGGVTPARGHDGDNAGRAVLTALIQSGRADRAQSAVYGCALTNRCCASEDSEP